MASPAEAIPAAESQVERVPLEGEPTVVDADPWRRMMAAVYEGVILFGVVFFFGYAFSALTSFRGEEGLLRTVFQLYMFAVLGAYFIWSWSNGRRTLPMKTMSVTLVAGDGSTPLTRARATWRYLIASLLFWGIIGAVWQASIWWLLLWPAPFLWTLADRQRRTLYDVLAGTRLVRTS